MKNIFIFSLLILCTNCGTYNNDNIIKVSSLENQLNSLEYNLILPETWHIFSDLHNELAYKPKNYPGKYPNAQIHIRKMLPPEHKNLSLNDLVDDKIKNGNKYIKLNFQKNS